MGQAINLAGCGPFRVRGYDSRRPAPPEAAPIPQDLAPTREAGVHLPRPSTASTFGAHAAGLHATDRGAGPAPPAPADGPGAALVEPVEVVPVRLRLPL